MEDPRNQALFCKAKTGDFYLRPTKTSNYQPEYSLVWQSFDLFDAVDDTGAPIKNNEGQPVRIIKCRHDSCDHAELPFHPNSIAGMQVHIKTNHTSFEGARKRDKPFKIPAERCSMAETPIHSSNAETESKTSDLNGNIDEPDPSSQGVSAVNNNNHTDCADLVKRGEYQFVTPFTRTCKLIVICCGDNNYRIYATQEKFYTLTQKKTYTFRCPYCTGRNKVSGAERFIATVKMEDEEIVGDRFPEHHPRCKPFTKTDLIKKHLDVAAQCEVKIQTRKRRSSWNSDTATTSSPSNIIQQTAKLPAEMPATFSFGEISSLVACEEAYGVVRSHRVNDKFFHACLDISRFRLEDLKVFVVLDGSERSLVVECNHGERQDKFGYFEIGYKRRFLIPANIPTSSFKGVVTSTGHLLLNASAPSTAIAEVITMVPIDFAPNK